MFVCMLVHMYERTGLITKEIAHILNIPYLLISIFRNHLQQHTVLSHIKKYHFHLRDF